MKPTDSQQKFIDYCDSNVLLSASAGSGKTLTMVNKLVSLIVNKKVAIKNILTLTFTRAAAFEMKQRLTLALSDVLNNQPNNAFVAQQLEDLNLADIGTIDSLCNKIVKKYFYIIGIDPSFDMMDEVEESYILNKTIEKVCEEIQSDDEYFDLYESYLTNRSNKDLVDVIKCIYNYLLVMPNYDDYKNHVLKNCYSENVDDNICAKFLVDDAKRQMNNYHDKLAILKDLTSDDKFLEYINARLEYINEILNATKYSQICNIVANFEFPPLPRTDAEIKEELRSLDKDLKKKIASFQSVFENVDKSTIQAVKHDVEQLFELVEKVISKMNKQKAQMGKYSFSDLEHFTYKILCNESAQKELQNTYSYIFFDEYQDINELQDSILLKLSNNNLNLIGDVKQSIYEFRQATPRLFVEKFNKYGSGDGKVIKLNDNFRSDDNILQFVNMCFDKLITTKTIGIDYASDSRLVAGNNEEQVTDYNRVQLNIINKDSDGEDNEDLDYLQAEINLIIQKIKEYRDLGYEYSDIAIITRDRGDLARKINKSLQEYKIPCSMDLRANIYEMPYIQLLVALIKLIDNYRDDISWASVMLSPIGEFTEQELVDVHKFGKKEFYNNVIGYDIDDAIGFKLNKLKDYLSLLRHYLTNHTVAEMLYKVLRENNLYNHYLSMPDGENILTYIDEFIKSISAIDNITHVVEFVDSQSETDSKLNIVPNAKKHVTLSTIHSAKGLEYKCVIFCSTGKQFRFERNSSLNISKKYGVGVKHVDIENRKKYTLFVKNACLTDNNRAILEEEIRLLYVALTRARENLCIIGSTCVSKLIDSVDNDIYSSKNYLQLLFKGFKKYQLNNFATSGNFILNKNEHCKVSCAVFDGFEIESGKDSKLSLDKYDESLTEELNKFINYKYPYGDLQNVATKNSVTSILSEENDYVNTVENMTSLLVTDVPNYESLELGTAYHLVMQQIDYHKDNNINVIVENLVQDGYISNTLAKRIDIRRIINAVQAVKQYVNAKSIVLKEQQFTMRAKHSEFVQNGKDIFTIIQGVIDLAIINQNDIVLIDFKTNKTDEVTLANTYNKQLNLYASALSKKEHKQVKDKLLYSFYLQKFVRIN
ncbi:MAG: UvrD-helicase domain-containing protein [Clostridia bacterium]|nr:UvrD-helicase domain-containing protein [Clostridia bacterium]